RLRPRSPSARPRRRPPDRPNSMTLAEVEVGQYLPLPLPVRNETVSKVILDGCANLPLFPLPLSIEQRHLATASWVTDPDHLVWEVWHRGTICGILGISRIVVGLDALAHFAFFDRQ